MPLLFGDLFLPNKLSAAQPKTAIITAANNAPVKPFTLIPGNIQLITNKTKADTINLIIVPIKMFTSFNQILSIFDLILKLRAS